MTWTKGKYCRIFTWLNTDIFIRFREIPPFGVDGIRKITSNRSELKKMTAHEYEDMLLVCEELVDKFDEVNFDLYSVLYRFSMVF